MQVTAKVRRYPRGFGSASLKECIELLDATTCNTPAPLDSGVDREIPNPPQDMTL